MRIQSISADLAQMVGSPRKMLLLLAMNAKAVLSQSIMIWNASCVRLATPTQKEVLMGCSKAAAGAGRADSRINLVQAPAKVVPWESISPIQ